MAITKDEVSKEIKLDLPPDLPKDLAKDIKQEVGDFVIESILSELADSKTPVSGGKFKSKLSKAYMEETGKTFANLDLNGDMLNSLTSKVTASGVQVGIFNPDQAIKAYNHNVGDTLPKRQFIPSPKENFKRDIETGIRDIVASRVGEFQQNQNEEIRTVPRDTPVDEESLQDRVVSNTSSIDALIRQLFGGR